MATRPLLKDSLLLLNIYGVDPFKSNAFSSFRLAPIVTLLTVMSINIIFDLVFNWRGLDSMEGITALTSFLQILTKLSISARNRSSFAKVINKMNQFWPINKYGEELENEVQNILMLTNNIMKYMVGFLLLGVCAFYGGSLFAKTRTLAFPMYYPTDLNQSPNYEIVFGLEVLTSLVAIFFLVGFDFLFVSLLINITCELKIIKKGFGDIPINPQIRGDTKESLQQVYELIEHHNLILRCVKNVREIYSFWLLNIYFYNMIAMCVSMLSIIATGFKLQSVIKYGFVAMYFMIQLFFYCATGQHLITESESVSDVVYGINWWIKTQPELRKALVLVIQRSNKEEYLTAGGMFALNLQSFRKVTRSALSFFTLVNAVYKES